MLQVGLSLGVLSQNEEVFRQCKAAGITQAEISVGRLTGLTTLDFAAMRRLADRYGVELWSFHLPFSPFETLDISSPHEGKRSSTVAIFSYLIRQAGAAGIKRFVIHPSGEPIKEEERPLYMAAAKKSLAELAPYAEAAGGVIAVENLPRTCLGRDSADILELLSADARLRVCFDTNHLLGEDPAAFIRAMGTRIVTTHISDYDFHDERHWLPGEGKLDWDAVLQALQEVGYAGPWLYEVSFERPATLEEARPLTCEDFGRNAAEIFAGQKPTPRAAAKTDLPRWI